MAAGMILRTQAWVASSKDLEGWGLSNGYCVFLLGSAEVACSAKRTWASREVVDVGPGPLKPICAIEIRKGVKTKAPVRLGMTKAESNLTLHLIADS